MCLCVKTCVGARDGREEKIEYVRVRVCVCPFGKGGRQVRSGASLWCGGVCELPEEEAGAEAEDGEVDRVVHV